MNVLLQQGAERLIHLGDIGTVEVIDALCVNLPGTSDQIPAHLVFGNTDWDLDALEEYAEDLDVQIDHPLGRLKLEDGTELAFCHGHEEKPMQEALATGVRYLCHGHTHRRADERSGPTRIINPGALFRAQTYSVALLDTQADQIDFYEIDA